VKNGPLRSAFVPKLKNTIVRQLSDEFLVYDKETNKAHCLNNTAAEVWKLCDGETTVAGIVSAMESRSSLVDEQMVWLSLAKFARAGLLQNGIGLARKAWPLSRREAVWRVGAAAAALALPVVTSILVPTPAEAASCFHGGHSCGSNAQCCSGICTPVLHTCLGG
jgi:hypothetical protein